MTKNQKIQLAKLGSRLAVRPTGGKPSMVIRSLP